MKIFITKHKVIFISYLAVSNLIFAACQSDSSVNTNSNQVSNANTSVVAPKDDADELSTRIRLDVAPEEVVWHEEPLGKGSELVAGPTDNKLTAVLKYKSEDASKVAAQAEKIRPPQQAQFGVEAWFPEELTAQSQLSGDESLKGTVYAANDFFHSPYVNGKLTRVENTDYFILELQTQ